MCYPFNMSIDELDLPARAKSTLALAGVTSAEELTQLPPHILLCAPNFGRKTLRAVEKALSELGLSLSKDYPANDYAAQIGERLRVAYKARLTANSP
jgi:DNA-directed RNA polymerase alpha subunit